jgi:hypothetical protein
MCRVSTMDRWQEFSDMLDFIERVKDVCPICGKTRCNGHPPGDGDPRDGSGRASQGE